MLFKRAGRIDHDDGTRAERGQFGWRMRLLDLQLRKPDHRATEITVQPFQRLDDVVGQVRVTARRGLKLSRPASTPADIEAVSSSIYMDYMIKCLNFT
jgi:hypothetical protein